MAGGFTIKEEKIPLFRELLIENFEKSSAIDSRDLNLYLDSVIAPSALNEDFYNEINCLAPFGPGNNEPKFVIENIKVLSSRRIKDKHIESTLIGKDGSVFKGFAWNSINTTLEEYLEKKGNKLINIVGKMRLNEWGGKKKIDFMIEDVALN